MVSRKRILIISPDEALRVFITGILRTQDYDTFSVEDGAAGMQQALRNTPDVIILDMLMPRLDGYHVFQMLRADTERKIPLIMLSHQGASVTCHVTNTDTVLTTPFDPIALLARVESVLQRQNAYYESNPFVQLSGHIHIGHELSKFSHVAVGYADLDDLTGFNERYGSTRGDMVIGQTKKIIQTVLQRFGSPHDNVIHVRGDDFVFITTPKKIDIICRAIITHFDREVLQFYDATNPPEDELLSLSIAVVTNLNRRFTDIVEIGEIALELQQYVKKLPGSNYCINRRNR